MDSLIKFLKDKITDKTPLEEIVDVFEQMCNIPLEEDMILFETGTFTSFSPEPVFEISLVRQFPNDDEEFFQIHVDILYKPTSENKIFSEATWNEDLSENIFNYIRTDLDQSKESMYKLSYVIRVSAPDLDELKRRCDEVKDFYDDLNVKLVRPAGDMLGLHSEFLPASKRYINDYVQYVKSDFLAGLGFGATQQLGENTGIYIGYSVDTGRNVY